MKLSNNFISSDAIYFSLNSEDNKDVITYLNNKLQKSTLYNKIYEDENKEILSILYNDKSIHPILEEGRYFTKTDFFSNKKVAVIGKDILNTNYVIQKNNSIYFLFYNEIFEVIGIMNYGHGTFMNKTVFVNMDSVINKLNNIFCIDGNKEEVKKTIDDLTNKYFINLLSFQKSILNKILDLDMQSLILMDIALIIMYLIVIIILINYFYYLQEELYVYRILGFCFSQILRLFLFKINYIVSSIIFLFSLSMIVMLNLFIYEERILSIYMSLINIVIFIVGIYILTYMFVTWEWYKKIEK